MVCYCCSKMKQSLLFVVIFLLLLLLLLFLFFLANGKYEYYFISFLSPPSICVGVASSNRCINAFLVSLFVCCLFEKICFHRFLYSLFLFVYVLLRLCC